MSNRRTFIATLMMWASAAVARGATQDSAPVKPSVERKLSMRIKMEGFGDVDEANIKAVLRSTAGEIWRHCPNTRLEPGFEIYHNSKHPIAHFERSGDGNIVIGLAVEGRLWARFAHQFAHEFAHALMDHSNDWRRLWRKAEHGNQWLEECLCETASLFCLRAMAQTWTTKPPYPNWKSYAPSLADYVAKHLASPQRRLPDGQTFAAWFAAEEPGLRKNGSQRDKNTVIAQQLLPLFEATPSGWEALSALKLGKRDIKKPLAEHLEEWRANAPAPQRAFIIRCAAIFGVPLRA